MYLSHVKLWNFRKFGSDASLITEEKKLREPDLAVPFERGLNVLVGENDSGKTAIIDAIKLVLKTHSFEVNHINEDDFFKDTRRFRIECHFSNLEPMEAKNFTEWLTLMDDAGEVLDKPKLKVILDVRRTFEQFFQYDVKAGPDDEGKVLNSEARENLLTTYLRPLRDAENEFIPKRNSRLSQILQGHHAFKGDEKDHHLVKLFEDFNTDLGLFFDGKKQTVVNLATQAKGEIPFNLATEGKQLLAKAAKGEIDKHLFAISDFRSLVSVSPAKLKSILETLALDITERNSGLGTYNKLYIAAELLHLEKTDWDGLKLGLIEEIEAHLHPQAQLRVIDHLQNHSHIQFILTTHSPNLASKVRLKNLIICSGDTNGRPSVFPLGSGHTKLNDEDYLFLQRFLDVTKANLFFSRGVILVEGWAEEILIPALAKKIGFDLTKHGVSVVNVGNTALLRYANIFLRTGDNEMCLPVSVATDVDVREYEKVGEDYEKIDATLVEIDRVEKEVKLKEKYDAQSVKSFICPNWTLEYSLSKSKTLGAIFQDIVKQIHTRTSWAAGFEKELAAKLINSGLDKTEIAYRLAQKLEDDMVSGQSTINIDIDDPDDTIHYLIQAIRYACEGLPKGDDPMEEVPQ